MVQSLSVILFAEWKKQCISISGEVMWNSSERMNYNRTGCGQHQVRYQKWHHKTHHFLYKDICIWKTGCSLNVWAQLFLKYSKASVIKCHYCVSAGLSVYDRKGGIGYIVCWHTKCHSKDSWTAISRVAIGVI